MAKVFLVDLESINTRYTSEWKVYLPELLKSRGHLVQVISGAEDIPVATTPGAFLNFGGTNVYKSTQVEKISRLFCTGSITAGDHFLFADAWHPGIINLKYMSELLGIPVKIHALWHSGSYDPHDFLGRLVGDKPWVRHAEKSFFHAIDFNYFATGFHIDLFEDSLLDLKNDLPINKKIAKKKIVRTGWPMEYMPKLLKPFKDKPKRDLIVFPHRIAPEKQVEIFRDLSKQLLEFDFVVCQDQELTKVEYHNLLAEAKIVFSCSLQETLGIGCYEGALLDAIPMVPGRLSYKEMYFQNFQYPSEWTENWHAYISNRAKLCYEILKFMNNYNAYVPMVRAQTERLTNNFFSCDNILNNLQ
jgi:hypothetical protein